VNFFAYIGPKESRSISYNSVYLTLACVGNFAATMTFYVYQSSNETDDYRLVFIVSISLLREILNACQYQITQLYLIYSLIYTKKLTSFCQVLKEKHTKQNRFLFFCINIYVFRIIICHTVTFLSTVLVVQVEQSVTNYLRMLYVAVAPFSPGGVAIRYVLLVLRMTSRLHMNRRRGKAYTKSGSTRSCADLALRCIDCILRLTHQRAAPKWGRSPLSTTALLVVLVSRCRPVSIGT